MSGVIRIYTNLDDLYFNIHKTDRHGKPTKPVEFHKPLVNRQAIVPVNNGSYLVTILDLNGVHGVGMWSTSVTIDEGETEVIRKVFVDTLDNVEKTTEQVNESLIEPEPTPTPTPEPEPDPEPEPEPEPKQKPGILTRLITFIKSIFKG